MNPKNCKITGIHEPMLCKNNTFQCRWCHHQVTANGTIIIIKHSFNKDETYQSVVKFYVDKRGYTKEKANMIAQKIIEEQMRVKV